MGLKSLNEAGVSELLLNATALIRKRGLAKGLRVDPETGNIDLIAALAITAGAAEDELMSSVSLNDFRVIASNEAKFMAAYEVLDAFLMEDPEQWADHPQTTENQVCDLMVKAAWRLKIAII